MRALPEPLRADAEFASTSVVVDAAGWDHRVRPRPAPPHLEAVQNAVVRGQQVVLDYVDRGGSASSRVVHPLGLAAKGSVWYLVANTEAGLRTFRIDRIASVSPNGLPVERPDGFDLESAWQLITDEVEERRTPLRARALVSPDMVPMCYWVLGNRVRIGPSGPDGRVEVELRGHSLRALAAEIAGFGRGLEVVDPPELRAMLAQIGAEVAAVHADPAGPAGAPA